MKLSEVGVTPARSSAGSGGPELSGPTVWIVESVAEQPVAEASGPQIWKPTVPVGAGEPARLLLTFAVSVAVAPSVIPDWTVAEGVVAILGWQGVNGPWVCAWRSAVIAVPRRPDGRG